MGTACDWNKDEFVSLCTSPLSVLACHGLVSSHASSAVVVVAAAAAAAASLAGSSHAEEQEEEEEEELVDLPFDVSQHPVVVNNPPAAAMIKRISADLKASSTSAKAAKTSFNFLTAAARSGQKESELETFSGANTLVHMQAMQAELEQFMGANNAMVRTGIATFEQIFLLHESSSSGSSSGTGDEGRARVLQRFQYNAGKQSPLRFEPFVASLSSTSQLSDVQQLNPFLTARHVEAMNTSLVKLLFVFSRAMHAAETRKQRITWPFLAADACWPCRSSARTCLRACGSSPTPKCRSA
jgi:hypothetical protein